MKTEFEVVSNPGTDYESVIYTTDSELLACEWARLARLENPAHKISVRMKDIEAEG